MYGMAPPATAEQVAASRPSSPISTYPASIQKRRRRRPPRFGISSMPAVRHLFLNVPWEWSGASASFQFRYVRRHARGESIPIIACSDDGVPSFDRIRYRRHDASVFLYAFDLIELNGDDLRREPLEVRKATLASVLAKAAAGLRLNEHLEHEDLIIVGWGLSAVIFIPAYFPTLYGRD
jgi:hypothetical protein